MADTSIGRLTIDISDVQAKINEVNNFLGKIGANVDLESKLSDKISTALNKLVEEAKKAGEEVGKALSNGATSGKGSKAGDNKELKEAIKLWKEYYSVMAQAEGALRRGDVGSYNAMREEASAIYEKAKALREEKDVYEQVANARKKYENAQALTVHQHMQKLAREEAQEQRELAKAVEEVQKAKAKNDAEIQKQNDKDSAKQLSELIDLYQRYYDYRTKAIRAESSGNQAGANLYNGIAGEIHQQIEDLTKYNDTLRQTAEASDKVVKAQTAMQGAIASSGTKQSEQEAKELERATQAYIKLEEAKSKAKQLEVAGKENTPEYANAVKAVNDATAAYNQFGETVKQSAEASDRAKQAIADLNNVVNAVDNKTATKNAEERQQQIEKATQAYIKLAEAQSKVTQLEIQGKKDTPDYANAAKSVNDAAAAYNKFSKEIKDAAEASDRAKQALSDLKNVEDAVSTSTASASEQESILNRITQAYFELKEAVKRYNAEQQNRNELGMAAEQSKIGALMQEVSLIQESVNASNMEESVKQKILNTIEQCVTLEAQHTAQMGKSVSVQSEMQSQISGLISRYFSLIAIIRTIKSLIQNTVEYASEYYDKMNEIQIITQKSNEEVAKLGNTYRDIAEMMNVSSLDMADAAIYFTRQGLGAAEIENRLKNVTMYAKTANVEFTEAAEIITSVVNSMNLVEQEAEDGRNAAQRVADVFLKVGDNAATSGQEIGSAMQKAAAAAGTFGVSLETLASYIATVSETTRQEARTIGTAFNTIIARLHSIRTTGYNADDETKVNDIAKALNTVNIQLMDQEGNWRDMETIFEEVASVWNTLTDKQRSYIATTMAGVKQQNVFLALMKDMAKGAENGSRYYELLGIAMDSAGTAQEKYATWTDSVTAAQERLTVAQEKFYSLLDASVIKGWNDMLADWINNIVAGADATNGLNIILPVAIGLITALSVAIKSAGVSSSFFATVWETHPVLVTIAAVTAGVVALVSVISSLASASETQKQRFDELNSSLLETQTHIDSLVSTQNKMNDMFESLSKKAEITNDDIEKYSSLLETISKVSPEAKNSVDQFKEGLISQQEVAEELNAELEKVIANQNEVAKGEAIRKYLNWSPEEQKDKFLKAYQQFDFSGTEGLDRNDAFAALLFNQKNKQIMWNNGLTDFYNEYMEKYKQYLVDFATIYDDMETIVQKAQRTIAEEMWSKFFDASSTNISDSLLNEINEMISDVLPIVTRGMNDLQIKTVRQQLLDKIIGVDGDVSNEEYQKAGIVLADAINEVEVTAFDQLRYISQRVFGNELPDEIGSLFMNDDAAQAIADGYASLLEQGFSMVDIDELLRSLSVDQWENLGQQMKNKLINEIGKIANTQLYDVVSTDEEGRETIDMLMWTQLDNTTLKLIRDMLDVGVNIEDIKQLMRDAGDETDEFITSLKHLGEENGVTEQQEKTVMSAKEISTAIKNAKKELKNFNDVLKQLSEGKHVSFDDLIDIASTHPELLENISNPNALFEQMTTLRDSAKNEAADVIRNILLDSEDFMKNSEYAMSGFKTLREYIEAFNEAGSDETASEWIESLIQGLLDYTDAADGATNAAESWLEEQAKIAEQNERLNWAKSNNYIEEIDNLRQPFGGEKYDTDWMENASAALDRWNTYDAAMQKSIYDTYPNLVRALREVEDAEKNMLKNGDEPLIKASKNLQKELDKIERRNSAKYFKSTNDAIKKLEEGTISASDAFDVFNKEVNNVSKAHDEIIKAQAKLDKNTKLATNDVNDLASVLGITAEQVIDDFPAAVAMFDALTAAGQETFNELNKTATMKILGIGEADFSKLQNGMVAVQDTASATVQMLLALGQFKLEEREVEENAEFPILDADGKGVTTIKATASGKYQFLVPTTTNPFSGGLSSGGGGSSSSGGGGGGSKNKDKDKNKMTEVERSLDRMSQVNAIQEYQQSFYQSNQKYHENAGQIQGVIAYMQQERDLMADQNKTLESNIVTIENYLKKKRAELATLKEGDEKYDEVADDVDKLQKAHQTYTKQLIDNKTAMDELTESMKEQRNKIRDMEIDLRETILKAIEDREQKTENMLNAEIQMEDKILDVITRRYEKERDQIIETTNLKIDALQEERDLLEEQLQLRKEQAQQEDKMKKLAELEAQYQRISADPTRAKEAKKIQQEIADLRDEMAWDAAEQEVKAQQDSLDQQVESLEDYIQYVEEYYEELFKHPTKLIAEMEEILKLADDEIIDWLKNNDEEFATYTTNKQSQTAKEWQQMLDDRRGKITTYWEEVEEIITKGDDYIIQFLKDNSADYAAAGKLQAEKYVEEWKKKLEDLRKANEAVQTEIAASYDVVNKNTSNGSDSGSGGGGGGGGGGKKKGYRYEATLTYINNDYGQKIATGKGDYKDTEEEAKADAKQAAKNAAIEFKDTVHVDYKAYKNGGIIDYTGPAWVDGSKKNPESILNPYQTRLFETFVQAMERMSRIAIPTMPNLGGIDAAGSSVSVGDINVYVDNLDTDDDYEELAKKVSDVLMERIGRTTVVGGLRINSF